MNLRIAPCCVLSLVVLAGCFPPPLVDSICEGADTCGTTQPASTTGDAGSSTRGELDTGTGVGSEGSAGSIGADADSGDATTDLPAEPPMIVDGVVIPDYIDDNGVLAVEVRTRQSEGVRMQLDSGVQIELTPAGEDEFVGEIPAFTGLDNQQHKAVLVPWRETLEGEARTVDYVISLPTPGSERESKIEGPGGRVAAIALLPDGRPVELGTYQEMGASRCYLHLRDKHGGSVERVDLLPSVYCAAIDLKIDRESGHLYVLVEGEKANNNVWWAGKIPAWGMAPENIGNGAVGDTALALAARPDMVAVCGSRKVPTPDKLDALAVLLRPGKPAEARLFDYRPGGDMNTFTDTARDCVFAGDTLVLVGETNGRHDNWNLVRRDRHMVIQSEVITVAKPVWTVAGLELGVQTRALALDVDDQGRYHLVGDKCNDTCEPEGELWTYEPNGTLVDHGYIGPLGSSWFGPHDIAWSPAGYAVVAFGEMYDQSLIFKVQAFTPGVPVRRWNFSPDQKQGLQLAVALAVGDYGEVYAGGVAIDDQPAFKRIGG